MRWLSALSAVLLVGCSQAAPAPPTPTTVPTVAPTVAPTATPVPAPVEPLTPDGQYYLGPRDAPVTLEMFGDFQCPVCGEFARTIEPTFVQHYVDTGKVKFVWHDYTWIGDESVQAALAARCAGRQGHFWAFHDVLFANQHGENLGDFTRANLQAFAAQLGLDPTTFSACMDGGQDLLSIKSSTEFGVNLGIDTTPAFLVNGDLRMGAPPLNRLEALMEYYLARTPH
jgi:protein-disulfide isomerase